MADQASVEHQSDHTKLAEGGKTGRKPPYLFGNISLGGGDLLMGSGMRGSLRGPPLGSCGFVRGPLRPLDSHPQNFLGFCISCLLGYGAGGGSPALRTNSLRCPARIGSFGDNGRTGQVANNIWFIRSHIFCHPRGLIPYQDSD